MRKRIRFTKHKMFVDGVCVKEYSKYEDQMTTYRCDRCGYIITLPRRKWAPDCSKCQTPMRVKHDERPPQRISSKPATI